MDDYDDDGPLGGFEYEHQGDEWEPDMTTVPEEDERYFPEAYDVAGDR